MVALANGALDEVVQLLHLDVTFTGDANRRASTAVRVIRGPLNVARFLLGLAEKYGHDLQDGGRRMLVNGELGLCGQGAPARDGHPGVAPRITAVTVADGTVSALWDIANPAKFTASPLGPPREPGTRHPS